VVAPAALGAYSGVTNQTLRRLISNSHDARRRQQSRALGAKERQKDLNAVLRFHPAKDTHVAHEKAVDDFDGGAHLEGRLWQCDKAAFLAGAQVIDPRVGTRAGWTPSMITAQTPGDQRAEYHFPSLITTNAYP
jgi:hypothetical protein